MKKNTENAADLVPIDYIGEDYFISSYGYCVFGLKLDMKEAFTMADIDKEDSEVKNFYHGYKNALLKLEEGVIITKYLDVYTLKYRPDPSKTPLENKTRIWNDNKFRGREVVFSDNYILVSIPYKRMKNKNIGPLLSRISKFEGIQNIESYRNAFESFLFNMSNLCDNVQQLTGNEMLELYTKVWNLGATKSTLDPIQIEPTNLVVGNKYCSVLTSTKLPTYFEAFSAKQNRGVVASKDVGNKTEYKADVSLPNSFLFPIGIGFPVNHILVETIKIEDSDIIETKLGKEKSELNFLIGLNDNSAIKKARVIDEFRKDKSEYGYKYASWGLNCILYSENKDKLQEYVNTVNNKGTKELGLSLVSHNSNLFRTFYASLPGASSTNEYMRLSYLEVVSYMTHIESFKKGNSDGVILVDMFGKPYVFDFWDENNDWLQARNGVLFAPTGEGKSFLINHLLDQSYWNGDAVFLIDVGASYKRITEINGGIYIDSKNPENLKFNPFLDCYQSDDGLYHPNIDQYGEKDTMFIDFISTVLVACFGGMSESQKGSTDIIKKSIVAYYKYVNENIKANKEVKVCFDSYYIFLQDVFFLNNPSYTEFINKNEFLLVMDKFKSEGEYGYLLNNETTFNLNARWVTFDLVGIEGNEDLSSPTLLIVMNMFEKMKKLHYGKRVRMFIDEAVDFLQGGIFSDYIGGLYRKIRKHGGQVFIITQSIEFLDNLDPLVKASILGNSKIKIILNHGSESNLLNKMQQDLDLSDSEVELLKNQQAEDKSYRIGFMKFGSMKGFLFRHEVSDETYAIYQTNAKEIKMIDELIANRGSIDSAVHTFVENKNKTLIN